MSMSLSQELGPADADWFAAEEAQRLMDAQLEALRDGGVEAERRWDDARRQRDAALLRWAHAQWSRRVVRAPVEVTEAPEVAPPPPPPERPATEQLARLVAPPAPRLELLLREGEGPPSAPPPWPREASLGPVAQGRALREVIEHIGSPPFLQNESDIIAEVAHLDESCGRLREWSALNQEQKRALIGTLTARARRVQDESDSGTVDRRALDTCFGRLTAFSKAHQPGFVYGLSRTHKPQHGSWLGDAELWWAALLEMVPELPDVEPPNAERALDRLHEQLSSASTDDGVAAAFGIALDAGLPPDDPRLVDLAAPYFEVLQRKARLKPLRQAVRKAREDAEAEAEADRTRLPEDWPHLERTRGKRALIVGGEQRDVTRQRIQDAFGFVDLQWFSPAGRGDGALTDRARAVDVVLVLHRFIGPDVRRRLGPACEEAAVLLAGVERGFGVGGVRAALERSWS